ncbi:hypothetical protein OAR23_01200 [bacterium]|nr:hypothetical protein [bacterium]
MTDVKFDIAVTGIKDLKDAAASFDRLGKVSAQLSAQYKPLGAQTVKVVQEQNRLKVVSNTLRKAFNENRISLGEYQRAMSEEIRKSQEKVLTDKVLIAQQKKRTKALQEQQKETARLTKLYAPARVAADEYKRKLVELQQAEIRGIISKQEAGQAIRLLQRDYYNFTQGLATGGNQFAKFNVEAYRSAQTFKRHFNTGLQQAGYQVGDFFVQIQSGQSALVALGQQGSQLAGIFGPYGALAGAFLAIGTAIGTIIMQTKDLGKSIDELSSSLNTLKTAESALGDIEGFKLSDSLMTMAETLQGKGLQDVRSAANELLGEYMDQFEDVERSLERKAQIAKNNTLQTMKELQAATKGLDALAAAEVYEDYGPLISKSDQEYKDTEQAYLTLQGIIRDIKDATLETDAASLASELVKSVNTIIRIGGLTEKQKQTLLEAVQAQGIFNLALQHEKKLAEENQEAREGQEELLLKAQEQRIAQAIETEKAATEKLLKYLAKIKADNAAGDLAILNTQAQAEIDLMAANAKYESDQNALRQKELDETNQKITELAERLSIPFAQALGLIRQAKAEATVGLDAFGGPGEFKYSTPTKFKPSKAKVTKAPKDALVSLMQNLTLQKELLGVEEDRASVLQALGESRNKYTEEQIQRAVDLTEKIRLQTEALELQKQVGDMIGQTFEDAFMSMIDGTKSVQDAFKQMASEIIKELYRIFVVKQITGMIATVAGDATSLMSGSNPFAFDGGGYTGSGPRSGGLDGKGGFMAMLHPRETVVDHTKGQGVGGEVINVTQNINVSTGVQQTVRAEIKQLMPQIANSAKSAVLDAKRRGGAYGRGFA